MIRFFGGHTTTATWNNYQKLRSKLKKTSFDFGFNFDGSVSGYIEIDAKTNEVIEGGLILVAEADTDISTPIYPCVFLRFEISGSLETKLYFELKETGQIGLDGSAEISVGLQAGIAAGIEELLMAYAGGSGTLNCKIDNFSDPLSETLEVSVDLAVFLELEVLLWERTYEWNFAQLQIYPQNRVSQAALMSITRDDLQFIEPLQDSVTYTIDSTTYKPNVQRYCSPRIVELDNGKMLMTYIDDLSSRSDENRTVLMYSIYNGTSWSAAQPVFDDGTMDYAPIIYPDGNGGAHIVWQNSKTVFGTDITLDEMSTNMELYYTHWDGNAFSETVALTNNSAYETNYNLSSNGNNVTVVWQQNSENDPFALEGSNSIHRKQLIGELWQTEEVIASNLSVVNSVACSYDDNSSIVAYSVKTNTDLSSVDDMEVYYYSGTELIRVTENNTSDTSVYFLDGELYWLSNGSVMCMVCGNTETIEAVINNLPESVTTFKVLKNSNNQKAIVWDQTNETAQFYGAYYNDALDEFGNIAPLTAGNDVIRGWDACMMSTGKIELAYCAAETLEEAVNGRTYGQIDLIQQEAEEFYDVSVNQIVTYSGEVVAGETITLSADVYNNGSMDISGFDVEIIDSNGNAVDSCVLNETLAIGGSANLEIPFTIPQSISRTNYTLRITPHDETDTQPLDNETSFEIGYADLAVKSVQEIDTDTGRQLQVTVTNQGYEKIEAAQLKIYSGSIQGTLLSNINITELDAGEEVTLTYDIAETSLNPDPLEPNLYYLLLVTDLEEANYSNNSRDVFVHSDCALSLVAGNGGVVQGAGNYNYGSMVTISAIPNEGYIFEGWYENGKCLDNLSDEYTFTVFTNRSIEARFIPNDMTITDVEILGTLETENVVVFSAKAEGGCQPYEWEYAIYKDEDLCYSVDYSTLDYFEWTPTEIGDYTIVTYVTDETGYTVTYSEEFSIT